jgi:hypothetical protein
MKGELPGVFEFKRNQSARVCREVWRKYGLVISVAATKVNEPVVEAAWKLLFAAQKEDGSFNGPLDPEQAKESAANPDQDWVTFREDYHATLAALLAVICAPPEA